MRVPVYVHGCISCEDIERAFASIGVLVRTEGGRLVADPLPAFLRRAPDEARKPEEQPKNVRALRRAR